jgi:hypothetical protein
MTQNIQAPVIAQNFKVAVIGGQPAIHGLTHLHTSKAQPEAPGGLLSAIAAVTFYFNIFHGEALYITGFPGAT